MFTELMASGSGGGGFFQSGVTPNTSTPLEFELGFAPKQVVVYMKYTQPSTFIIRLDVENNAYYKSIGTTFEAPESVTTYQNDIYVVGTKLYYKAHNSNYAVESVIIAC
jgi:hypothetical protein